MSWENKPVSLHRPLMLDNGISAPQVAKFSRHLSTDPLHDPYFIQSVGLRQPLSFVGFLCLGWENVWSNNTGYTASSLTRAWQKRGLPRWVTFIISSASLFQEGHVLSCSCAAVLMWEGKTAPAHQTLHVVTPAWLTLRAERKKYVLAGSTMIFLTRARLLQLLTDNGS